MPTSTLAVRHHEDMENESIITRPPSTVSHSKMVPAAIILRDAPSMPQLPPSITAVYELGAKVPVRVMPPAAIVPSIEDDVVSEISSPGPQRSFSAGSMVSRLGTPQLSYDLDAIDELALKFFSLDHLNIILRDPRSSPQFMNFMLAHLAGHVAFATEYTNIQKALTAIEYAHSIVENLTTVNIDRPPLVASLDRSLEARTHELAQQLGEDVLPQFLTHRMTEIAADTLAKDITGQSIPIMRDLLPSLAEVYCICDPSLPDRPIVYASDGFLDACEYDREDVIGRGCGFLQGPQTDDASVKRIAQAITEGKETTETLLNYRRNGTPYLNLITVAPLFDNKGNIRYWLGAQIDVSSLVQDGRGFDSFSRLLSSDRADSALGHHITKTPSELLCELGAMLSSTELSAVNLSSIPSHRFSVLSSCSSTTGRRHLGLAPPPSRVGTPPPTTPSAPRSVFTHYLLVRPTCTTIVFTSPALRIPGLAQTSLLDRIAGPAHVKQGLIEAFEAEAPVTAKVQWTPVLGGEAKERWLHCTPLLGLAEIGVWMVLMLDPENKGVNPLAEPKRDERREVERAWGDYLRRRSRDEQRR